MILMKKNMKINLYLKKSKNMNRAQRRKLKSKKGAQYRGRSRPTDNGRMNSDMKGRASYK